ncbi:hypothetical protein MKK68_09965 [Methylobacterium sp. E-016]|uniref:hypothetical protein n=1 Tax=Methylobacterium sp. E-016 TaxID=2836556 RepID=UPI001FB9833E|nr:hypothetical protein [Methylobacterium sp. E-016]MCJ2075979.1 hypothetical protein [Methylobacterium sp. E-016]
MNLISEITDDVQIVELLLADSSKSSVRTAIGVLFLIAGPLIALIPMYFVQQWDSVLYCSIAGPITGFCGSVLWLFWPWIRSDMQNNAIFVFHSHKNDRRDDNHSNGGVRHVVGQALDRAEKQSYKFVGATLALSWLFSLIAVLVPIVFPPPATPDLASIEQQLIGLSQVVKSHTRQLNELGEASKKR